VCVLVLVLVVGGIVLLVRFVLREGRHHWRDNLSPRKRA
jgi:hypothetical protein